MIKTDNTGPRDTMDFKQGKSIRSRAWRWAALAVLVVAVLVNFSVGIKLGLARPMESDAHYFLQAATSLAQGQGFKIRDTFWPDTPAMSRSPGWPSVISIGLRLCPSLSPDAVMRCLCLAVNSLIAVGVFLLSWKLLGGLLIAFLSGLGYAIHPVGVYLAYDGDSELLFILLLLIGTLFLIRRASRWFVLGCLTLGLASLVRPNFLLWIVCFLPLLLWVRWNGRAPVAGGPTPSSRLVALGVLLFLLPSLLWAVRNYRVCGHFPVLSTLRGQTFYGGNNEVVVKDFKYWGYWVFPNSIPGERPMIELAKNMSEYEVDRYYYDKGKAYIHDHARSMPWLWLGKWVRAYIPIPWNLTVGSGVVSAYRWLLYIAAAVGVWSWWKTIDPMFRMTFAAMLLVNVATVVVFWGCARFAFPLDPFLLPFAAAGVRRAGGRNQFPGSSIQFLHLTTQQLDNPTTDL